MSSYQYNGTDIVCVSQAKPEHSFSHARSYVYIAFNEFCWSGNADHKMINLSVAWLTMYMTVYWLLASKA